MQHVSILYSKKNGDADILLSKNQIKAVCRMVFNVVKRTIELHDTPNNNNNQIVRHDLW